MNALLDRLTASLPLTSIDCGEFSSFRVNGLRFSVEAFHAEGFGHVSLMRAKGFFGLVRMDTLIATPSAKDLPLLSYDRMQLFGKDMLLLELYDTAIVPFDDAPFQSVAETLSDIADYEAPPRWYDSLRLAGSIGKVGKKMHRARFDAAALAFAETYRNAEAPDTADKDAKRIKTEAYSEGLLQNGGASTDLFVKKLGAEKTARLFCTLLFRFQP